MQDRFGREITDNGDGTYSVGGITANNILVFDAMAPEGWVDPNQQAGE